MHKVKYCVDICVVAFLVRGNKIVFSSTNEALNHAEIKCLKRYTKSSSRNRQKLDLVVLRTLSDGSLGNSKPCMHCIEEIKKSNVRKVIYSVGGNEIIIEKKDDIENDFVTRGVKASLSRYESRNR